jgi:hypothetical protein
MWGRFAGRLTEMLSNRAWLVEGAGLGPSLTRPPFPKVARVGACVRYSGIDRARLMPLSG